MKCKNCKVQLAPYLDKCPLCGEQIEKQSDNHSYNNEIENFSTRINVIYFSRIAIKILMISSIICLVLNLIINKKLSWSLYVIFSSLYIFSFYLYLVLHSKKLAFILNMLLLESLLFIISYLTHDISWFACIVGPVILEVTLFILLNVYLSKYRNILRNFSCLLIYISLCLNIIDGLLIVYNNNKFYLTWSINSSIPLLVISIILMILSFNKTISEEIEKRFFI